MRASPSALKDFAKCPRKWAFRRFLNLPRVDQPWFRDGRELDEISELYLLSGERPAWGASKMGDLFYAGVPFLPPPGEAITQLNVTWKIDGHEIAGRPDFVHYDVQAGELLLGDIKSYGNKSYNLTTTTLRVDEQFVGYGGGLCDLFDVEWIRGRWVYHDKKAAKPKAYPVEVRESRKDLTATARKKFLPVLDAMDLICQSPPTTAAEINAQIPNDPTACDGCGRMCDYATQCNLYQRKIPMSEETPIQKRIREL